MWAIEAKDGSWLFWTADKTEAEAVLDLCERCGIDVQMDLFVW